MENKLINILKRKPMLQILILTAILASLTYAGCNARNYYKRAKLRAYGRPEPYFKQTPVPRSHYLAYYRDWALFIGLVLVVAYGIYWILNN